MSMRVLIATAIYPTDENPATGSYVRTQVEALRDLGLRVDVFVLEREGGAAERYLGGAREIRRLAASGDYDLLHAHYSFMGMIARLQRQLPVVVTFHGSDLLGAVGDASGRHTFKSRLAVKAGQALSRGVAAAIVQSDEMAGKLGDRDRVHVISHEVDLELFKPVDQLQAKRELGLEPARRYLLFAANPSVAVKRFPLAEAAHARLREAGHDVEMCIVHRDTQERLAQYMNACDALVFPSFQEGSPNIVKQALACNLPIVATEVGDVRELFGDAADCFICPPSVDAFAGRLAELVTAPRRSRGRERVEHLTKPYVAGRIRAVYGQVLQRHEGSSADEGPALRPAGRGGVR